MRSDATGDAAAGRWRSLACPPGERHDLGLIAFGLVLRSHGWRILFLGADTPLDTIGQRGRDDRSVSSSWSRAWTRPSSRRSATACGSSPRLARLVLAGTGASDELCGRLRIERLDGDLVAAAESIANGS